MSDLLFGASKGEVVMKKQVVYQFEWDPKKDRLNIKNHRIPFERGVTVFRDSQALTIYDEDHSPIEDRWITMGHDRAGMVLVVSHTFRKETEGVVTIRMISARKATKTESDTYERR
ncbi:MAG: BrnT family toxin [Candidatus Methylomirabilia bacterium]